jgi:hypothetical protein
LKEKSKPSGNLTVRLPKDVREWLEVEAEKEIRPLANMIVFFLRKCMEDRNFTSVER